MRARDGRHRNELYGDDDRTDASRPVGRRGCRPRRHALLQQTDPGRPVPPLRRGRKRGRSAHVLYNVPARTGVDFDVGTIEQLTAIPSIIGIKDASGDPGRPSATALVAGHRFIQFCGDDAGAVAFNFAGGRGCISVVANAAPALCRALQQACRVKDWAQARSIQNSLDPLIAALAREPNPGPIKQALSLLRPEFSREPRLPLVGVAPGTASAIEHALRGLDPGMRPAGQRAA